MTEECEVEDTRAGAWSGREEWDVDGVGWAW